MDDQYERQKERRLKELRDLDKEQMQKVRNSLQQALAAKAEAEAQCVELQKQLEAAAAERSNDKQQLQITNRAKGELEGVNAELKRTIAELQASLTREKANLLEKEQLIKKLEGQAAAATLTLSAKQQEGEQFRIAHTKKVEELLKTNELCISELQQKHRGALQSKDEFSRIKQQQSEQRCQKQMSDLIALYENKDTDLAKQSRCFELENRRLLEENKRLLNQITMLKETHLNLEQKLNGQLMQVRIRVKEREYECDNLRKQLEFEKAERRQQKDRIRNVLQQREEDRHDFDEAKKRNREELRLLKQTMEERLNDFTKESERQTNALQKQVKELRQDNRELSQLCSVMKAQKKQLQTQLKRELQEQAVRTTQQREAGSKEAVKLQRQLQKKQKQLDQSLKEHTATKQKLDKVLVKFEEMLGRRNEVQKENKMLLSEIIFWRDKNKDTKRSGPEPPDIHDLKSEESELMVDRKEVENLRRDVETYKALIKEMEKDITLAVEKLDAKNKYIAELEEKNQGLAQLLGRLDNRQLPPSTAQNRLGKRVSNDSIFSLPKYEDFEQLLDSSGGRPL